MKITRIDAHDRLLEFRKQADYISKGCQDCINNRPDEFGMHPFYIFAHKRQLGMDERWAIYIEGAYESFDKVPTDRLIWVPRLLKPEAQVNSMLFKYYPREDVIHVLWMIPAPELWDQYTKNKLSESSVVCESIHLFKTDKKRLEEKMPDDLSEEQVKTIYQEIARNAKENKKVMI